jgi:Domain of unknown function (DUF4307)
MSNDFDFNDRYGIKPANRWRPLAGVILVVGIIWLLWAGLHHSRPEISASLISFSVSNDREIVLRYEANRRDPNRELTCTLVARDIDKLVVGQVDDVITAGQGLVDRSTAIPTRNLAATASVLRCL